MTISATARTSSRVKGNRLVKATRRVDAETTVAAYAYYGDTRRSEKVVSNSGTEEIANDGGDTTVRFYYCGTGLQPVNGGALGGVGILPANWNICETRDGSNQTTMQMLWGTRYTDELIFFEVNGDVTIGNDVNPDNEADGEDVEGPADHRYFAHQDRNWNVTAVTDYGSGVHGNIVERYDYTPYGQFVVLKGESDGNELANVMPASNVGNVFTHQALPIDWESASSYNRHRQYSFVLHRFAQADSAGYIDGLSHFASRRNNPIAYLDPSGLRCCFHAMPLSCIPFSSTQGPNIASAGGTTVLIAFPLGPTLWLCAGYSWNVCTYNCGCCSWTGKAVSYTCNETYRAGGTWLAVNITGIGVADCLMAGGPPTPACPP